MCRGGVGSARILGDDHQRKARSHLKDPTLTNAARDAQSCPDDGFALRQDSDDVLGCVVLDGNNEAKRSRIILAERGADLVGQ